jgi:hypothetical protein
MKRIFFSFLIFLFLFFPKGVSASSLIKISKEGNLTVNVLSASDSLALGVPQKSFLEVKEVAGRGSLSQDIVLKKEGDKYNLYLGGSQALDVTNWSDSVVEIEEKEEAKKIDILVLNDKFLIKQAGILTDVSYPLKVMPKEKKLSVETPFGDKLLLVMPYDAALTALRSKVLGKVDKDKHFELVEENKDIVYKMSGYKILNFFGFYKMDYPVTVNVSASTGEVVLVDEPWWLKIAGLFLT